MDHNMGLVVVHGSIVQDVPFLLLSSCTFMPVLFGASDLVTIACVVLAPSRLSENDLVQECYLLNWASRVRSMNSKSW
jgi:hypothetical protein